VRLAIGAGPWNRNDHEGAGGRASLFRGADNMFFLLESLGEADKGKIINM
jgi:hypothetical protein